MLIVQDMMAMIFLIVVSALQNTGSDIVVSSFVLALVGKVAVL